MIDLVSLTGDPGAGLFLFGVCLVLAASLISGLAGVSNELLLKKRDKDVGLWRKNIWTYQWGVIFNTIGLLFSFLFGSSSRTHFIIEGGPQAYVGYSGCTIVDL